MSKKKNIPPHSSDEEILRSLGDGVARDDVPFETDDECISAVLEEGEDIECSYIGYYNGYVSERDSDELETVVMVYAFNDLYYVMCGDDVFDLELITKSKEEAIRFANDIPRQNDPVEKQIENMHAAINDIDGLYYDPKSDHWNVKYQRSMLIEKARELDGQEIRREVARFNAFTTDLEENHGIHVISVYKKPRGWNDNQRYYVFELHAGSHYYEKEAHIPSNMQGKKRYPIDFFAQKWIAELEAQAKADEAGRQRLQQLEENATMPFGYDTFRHLAAYLSKSNALENCDGTLSMTKRWLEESMPKGFDIENAILYIRRCGGFCDCEVLLNADSPEYWGK